jgi:Uma2 family endonuclease
MSLIEVPVRQRTRRAVRFRVAPPPLENGDRLTRAEFERRYEAMPHVKKAELIEGVVYMPSPVHFKTHGEPHAFVVGWLASYSATTSGVTSGDNATVRLDLDNEVQPDALLRLDETLGGASSISDDDYIEGPPELIVEIAASSVSQDLHAKKKVYRRNGVQEYLVWRVYDETLDWFHLEGGEYRRLEAEDGIIRSRVFPGLHLAVEALLKGDLATVLNVLQRGTETEEHAAFVERLSQ